MELALYYRSPEWARRKKDYYRNHAKRCRVCNTTQNIELHHMSYESLGYELDTDLMPLCRPHHKQVTHRWRRRIDPDLRAATWAVVHREPVGMTMVKVLGKWLSKIVRG